MARVLMVRLHREDLGAIESTIREECDLNQAGLHFVSDIYR